MITIVPPHLYSLYQNELLDMFRLRYRVFKERLGWNVPTKDGLERDQYDDCDPTYILAFDDDGDLAGSWRMHTTMGPTMLGNTFPELLDGMPMPRSPDIWECSRFSIDTSKARSDSLKSMNRYTSEIIAGLIEHSLNMGIVDIITVCDVLIARVLPRFGADPYWKGTFHRIDNSKAIAVRFKIEEALLEKVQRAGGLKGSVIHPARTEPLPVFVPTTQEKEVIHA
jgi:N-acyl-L-homoserine lactone synthetase